MSVGSLQSSLMFTGRIAAEAAVVHLQGSDATLRMVNQMWHVLVAEDGNEKIRDELIEWMGQRC